MLIVVVLSFMVTLTLARLAPGVQPMPGLLLGGIGLYVAGSTALAALRTARSMRLVERAEGELPRSALRAHRLAGMVLWTWLIGGLAALAVGGLGNWVYDSPLGLLPLVPELALWAPFPIALILVWWIDYPFHLAAHRRLAEIRLAEGRPPGAPWTRGQYLAYSARHSLLFVAVPICLILLLTTTLERVVAWRLPEAYREPVVGLGSLAAAAAVFLIAPILIVRIWRTRRLPDGTVRQEIEQLCGRLGVRYREVLVWISGGVIANAAAMGIIGPIRYVLLSDALLEQLDPRAVLSVFAHEAGHVLNHHIFYSMLFAVSSATLCGVGADCLARLLGWEDWAVQLTALGSLAAVWWLVFGLLSRRFERQCDVLAAWAVSERAEGDDPRSITPEGAATFAWALGQIARLNGINPLHRDWRHGSIESRVRYVQWLGAVRGTRRPIDRTVNWIRVGLWLAMLAAVAAGVADSLLG